MLRIEENNDLQAAIDVLDRWPSIITASPGKEAR
jgi:hypothetical protein